MTTLTDEQCDEFRRMPCSFNDMIRAAYRAGQVEMRERAAKEVDGWREIDKDIANIIRALPVDA